MSRRSLMPSYSLQQQQCSRTTNYNDRGHQVQMFRKNNVQHPKVAPDPHRNNMKPAEVTPKRDYPEVEEDADEMQDFDNDSTVRLVQQQQKDQDSKLTGSI
ncbi:unnamed protein product [Didymodactylos carnosus]|uniref:Uncharacterized protein n=1 Tax=Didymodactylos carnosus TaxID=1234261 RepID=A0A815VIX0_9BILA|nr:unnamed protein product [Didymodactylos carnosus]CAF4392352.1 unnamed protein product [Didymodactylos carnosus]